MGLNAYKSWKEQSEAFKLKEGGEDLGSLWQTVWKKMKEYLENQGSSTSDYAEYLKTDNPRSQAIPLEELTSVSRIIYPLGGVKPLPGFEEPTVFVYSGKEQNVGFIIRSSDLLRIFEVLTHILVDVYQKKGTLGIEETTLYMYVTNSMIYFGLAMYDDVCKFFENNTEFPQDVFSASRAVNEAYRPKMKDYYVRPDQAAELYQYWLGKLSEKELSSYYAEFTAQFESIIIEMMAAAPEEEERDLDHSDDVRHDGRHPYDGRVQGSPSLNPTTIDNDVLYAEDDEDKYD